jgi:hypothetical protein
VIALAATLVLVAQPGLERRAEELRPRAERHLERIAADLEGLPAVDRIEVRLVKHAADLAGAAPAGHGAPEWAVGTAYPREGIVVVAARGRRGELLDMDQILAHELAHMALDRALGAGAVPRWLTEGFAYLHSSDASFERGRTLIAATFSGRLIPIVDLEGAFPAREDEAALAYAESYDFVAFLARRGRWDDDRDDGSRAAFRQLLFEIGQGKALDPAARAAFGRGILELEREWLGGLRERYLWLPIGLLATFVWVVGAGLLVLGWRRRRRLARVRMDAWQVQEDAEDAQR